MKVGKVRKEAEAQWLWGQEMVSRGDKENHRGCPWGRADTEPGGFRFSFDL